MKKTGFLCLVLAITLSTTAVPATVKHFALIFPVMIEDAAPAATKADGRQIVLSQPLRPVAAVRTEKDVAVHFKSGIGQGLTPGGPDWDFTIPAGAILIGAISDRKQVYCASKSLQDSFFVHYDVGLCLRDDNDDGIFDSLVAVDGGLLRIRSPIEIKYLEDGATQQAAVPYTKLDRSAIPTFDIRISYQYRGNFLTKLPQLDLGICWPESLPLSTEGVTTDVTCGTSDWLLEGRRQAMLNIPLIRDIARKGMVTWGPFTVTFSLNPDNTINAHVEPLKTGPAMLYNRGDVYIGGNTRDAFSILHLGPLEISGQPAARNPI